MPSDTKNFVILDDSNDLPDWKYTLQIVLEGKDLWDVVTKAPAQPAGFPNSKQVKAYRVKQTLAMAEIVKRVSRKQLPHIRHLGNNPAAVYAHLVEVNSNTGLNGNSDLWTRFSELRMTDATSMADHVAALRDIADRLHIEYSDKPSDAQFISTFLRSLPPTSEWNQFRRSIDGDIRYDDMEHVICRALNEYAQQSREELKKPNLKVEKKEDAVDNVVSDALIADIVAMVASRLNIGSPRPATQRSTSMLITCHKCGGRGHYKSICPNKDPPAAAGIADQADGDDDEVNYSF